MFSLDAMDRTEGPQGIPWNWDNVEPYVLESPADVALPLHFPVHPALEAHGYPTPLLFEADRHDPPGWEFDRDWFVDTSGSGDDGPALAPEQFLMELRAYIAKNPNAGFLLVGVGQLQMYAGAYQRR